MHVVASRCYHSAAFATLRNWISDRRSRTQWKTQAGIFCFSRVHYLLVLHALDSARTHGRRSLHTVEYCQYTNMEWLLQRVPGVGVFLPHWHVRTGRLGYWVKWGQGMLANCVQKLPASARNPATYAWMSFRSEAWGLVVAPAAAGNLERLCSIW